MMLVIFLIIFLIPSKILAFDIEPPSNGNVLSDQEIIDIANKIKELQDKIDSLNNEHYKEVLNLKLIIEKQDQYVIGLQEEIQIKDDLILVLEQKNEQLELSYNEYIKISTLALEQADTTIELLEKRVFTLEELNNEYSKKSNINIIERLQLVALGIAVHAIFK